MVPAFLKIKKPMNILRKLFILLILFPPAVLAQTSLEEKHRQMARDIVEAYNLQDFKKMKKIFKGHGIVRLFLSEKYLEKQFVPRFKESGKMLLREDKIIATKNKLKAPLIYENDTTEIEYFVFNFNRNDKFVGVGLMRDYFSFTPPKSKVQNLEAKIDTLLKDPFPKGFNGSILFCRGHNIVYNKNYGYSNIPDKTPLNDSSLFELASCSKQFTAAAIMKLNESGKLEMNDSLRKFFPLLPYSGVTVKHLLQHTSGLPDYMSPLIKMPDKEFCFNDDIIAWLSEKKIPADFAPGERYEYSNTGYAILASIVEKVSGMSYADYLNTQFFEPLGMERSRVYNSRRTKGEVIPNYAYGYVYAGKNKYLLPDEKKPEKKYVGKLEGIVGDGTVNSTASELVKWHNGLSEYRVLSKASLDSAYAPGHTNDGKEFQYGYGVMVHSNPRNGRIIAHTGGWPGYQTLIYRFVDRDMMLVILSNKEYRYDHIMKAAKNIAPLFLYE
jgi:CubicO group peptidase (beta-lactamase class C family)